jgi:hypothetical protein
MGSGSSRASGEAVERDGNYYGTAVNLAARLMSSAHGGQVVVSAATREIVAEGLPDDVVLTDLGQHHLRGVTSVQRVFALTAQGLSASFPPLRADPFVRSDLPVPTGRLIGRAANIDNVADVIASDCRLVTWAGPGGVGKTRLALAVGAAVRGRFPDGARRVELAPVGRAARRTDQRLQCHR